jgi:hypothetical protein
MFWIENGCGVDTMRWDTIIEGLIAGLPERSFHKSIDCLNGKFAFISTLDPH